MNSNTRNLNLDLIKLTAMFGVMCLHSQMRFMDYPIAHFLYVTAAVSIPLFFMTSGYLLLGKDNIDYKYSVKKIIGILRFVAIMTVLFYLLSGIRHGESFINATLGSLIQRGQLGIFWYFGAMVIIYACLPCLSYLYKRKFKVFIFVTVGLFFISSTIFVLNFTSGIHIEQNTIQTFRLWNWLFYFCLGGLIKYYSFNESVFAIVILIILNYLFQIKTVDFMGNNLCEYYYPSILVMLLSVFIFQYIRSMKISLGFINCGGKLFLPCYTIHSYVIAKTAGVFEALLAFTGIILPLLFCLFVCALTVLLSWMIMKVPYAEKIFRI